MGAIMKKKLPYVIFGAGIVFLVGCYFFFKKQIEKMLKNEEEASSGQNSGI